MFATDHKKQNYITVQKQMESTINKTSLSCYVQYLQQIHLHYTHTGVKEVMWRTGLSSGVGCSTKEERCLNRTRTWRELHRGMEIDAKKKRHADNINTQSVIH